MQTHHGTGIDMGQVSPTKPLPPSVECIRIKKNKKKKNILLLGRLGHTTFLPNDHIKYNRLFRIGISYTVNGFFSPKNLGPLALSLLVGCQVRKMHTKKIRSIYGTLDGRIHGPRDLEVCKHNLTLVGK